jgi:hypothetical protein
MNCHSETLATLALIWNLCGMINLCTVYVWARRTFDLKDFVFLLVFGPVFFAAISLLAVLGFIISSWADQHCILEASLPETTGSLGEFASQNRSLGTAGPSANEKC